VSSVSQEWFFFDEAERTLLVDVLLFLESASSEHAQRIRRHVDLVRAAGELIRLCPAIVQLDRPLVRKDPCSWPPAMGRTDFSGEALVELLCRVPDYDLDLHIPTKAVLGQAYLITKINFLKAAGYSLEALGGPPDLRERLSHETGQAIYSKLAEELFISIVTDPAVEPNAKMNAARFLSRIWEERLAIEIDDFAPVLESIWMARNKVRPVLGTMLGTEEVFQLFRETKDARFLEYFDSDDIPEEALLAFEEFLFGMSHEEITQLREYMMERSATIITLEEARTLLGRAKKSWAPQQDGAQALYTSYKKRRVKAHYRALTNTPGPKKTAEEYVMTAFLSKD